MNEYIRVDISAETYQQAKDILDALLGKKLVTGGQILEAPARFLWKGKVIDMRYCQTQSFTMAKHKEAIIETVTRVSIEEVPMVSFVNIDGNTKLLQWIETTVA